jgi:hypothetical protein
MILKIGSRKLSGFDSTLDAIESGILLLTFRRIRRGNNYLATMFYAEALLTSASLTRLTYPAKIHNAMSKNGAPNNANISHASYLQPYG